MKFWLSYLIFFPYVGFLNGIDVQPFFLIPATILLLDQLINRTLVINLKMVFFFLFIAILVFFRFQLNLNEGTEYISYTSFISTFFHLVIIFLAYTLINNDAIVINKKLILYVITTYILVGLIQYFDRSFLDFLVSRGDQNLSVSGRGVRSLASEPAVLGHLLICFWIIYLYLIRNQNNYKFYAIRSSLIFLFLSVTIPGSFYSAFFLFLLVILLIFELLPKWQSIPITSVSIGLAILLPSLVYFDTSFRFFYILDVIYNNPSSILEQGAMRRLLNIPISLNAGLEHGILGSGFSTESVRISQTFLGEKLFFYVSDRNMGGLVELFLRLGILSIPIFIVFFISLGFLKIENNTKLNNFFRIASMYIIFTYSSLANPIIWLIYFKILKRNN